MEWWWNICIGVPGKKEVVSELKTKLELIIRWTLTCGHLRVSMFCWPALIHVSGEVMLTPTFSRLRTSDHCTRLRRDWRRKAMLSSLSFKSCHRLWFWSLQCNHYVRFVKPELMRVALLEDCVKTEDQWQRDNLCQNKRSLNSECICAPPFRFPHWELSHCR